MAPHRSNSGQFIPLSLMVVLSIVVFTVGIINVARVARNKLLVQNLADAMAMYEAALMSKSMNKVADLNESMNHLYQTPANSNQPNDPCAGAPNNRDAPKGIGCYALYQENQQKLKQIKFANRGEAEAYARLIHNVGKLSNLFETSYNNFMGGGGRGTVSQNSAALFKANLFNDFPILRSDPSISVFVYNSKSGRGGAENRAKARENQPDPNPNQSNSRQNQPAYIDDGGIKHLTYESKNLKVCYDGNIMNGGAGCKTLGELSGQNEPVGFRVRVRDTDMEFGPGTGPIKPLGGGAIVMKRVSLMGLPSITIQAKAHAYLVMKSGSQDPYGLANEEKTNRDPNMKDGTFRPTYWIKLGK